MTREELQEIAENELEAREELDHLIFVCNAASCQSSQGLQLIESLKSGIEEKELGDTVEVKGAGCMGLCAAGPLVLIEPDGILYTQVKPEDAGEILNHLESEAVERLKTDLEMPFFGKQVKIVLENSGKIDPEKIEDYIAMEGYTALNRVITEMSPGEVIDVISDSGLRGRGGAGYPTGLKWSTVGIAEDVQKYVVCNADEGDPGAFMDRSVLESDPHRVLEGMAIAGYAVGADKGYIYVRAEYPLAIERLREAIKRARRLNLLGNNIFGSQFSFNLEIRLGAGAFVCGEETALLASIEGRQGRPRPRPPYPAEYGLWGHPTLINNVETFANVAPIIRNGAEWFASIGTENSKGTKVFAMAGSINNTGLIEVPMGITLRDIIYDLGGGLPEDLKFKAVQTGGPSGGCVPEEHLDMPVDYESLKEVGTMMGSGGMIVVDASSDMVSDVAKYFVEFCKSESCGKCVPCRVGTAQMYDLLDKISKDEATQRDLDLLVDLCDVVRNTSLCGLGQAAPQPVLSTLEYFKEDYDAHLQKATDKLTHAVQREE
ncbi:MAG: NADH-quinone oxidoreductase subunit NuoF [Candidatus Marinimicrobia bacterium]|nr:NADH-quinone oxidoreductase subunit NuoF [Candidatus Neomarinimicrobiota bacterium]MCF7827822.1 NADH-quinone oxidoreductase subunit NuoF [Candidatus Neomarinimicrobiota bacterium]MCF7879423.1 NADH-quinone oxidoreductase subunit NuoF [Candidatus Neomarinimicrobiota bacterium]